MHQFVTSQLTRFAEACSPGGNFLNFPTWYKYLDCDRVADKLTPHLDLSSPEKTAQLSLVGLALIEILLRIAGIVAIGFVIYGGYQFILSQGEPERAAAARNTIINAIIGLAIAISATGIVVFVASNLAK